MNQKLKELAGKYEIKFPPSATKELNNFQAKWIDVSIWLPGMLGKKTYVFNVCTKDEFPITIGQIKWFGRWRKYAFFPSEGTVYEQQCLEDIVRFLDLLKVEWKKIKANDTDKRALPQAGDDQNSD